MATWINYNIMNQVVKIHKIGNKGISIEEFDEGKSLHPTTTKRDLFIKIQTSV